MKKLLAMLLALVMVLSMCTVAAFAQSDTGSDSVDVDEPTEPTEPEPADPVVDENPETGLALCVIPMVAAGAAVAFAKKH